MPVTRMSVRGCHGEDTIAAGSPVGQRLPRQRPSPLGTPQTKRLKPDGASQVQRPSPLEIPPPGPTLRSGSSKSPRAITPTAPWSSSLMGMPNPPFRRPQVATRSGVALQGLVLRDSRASRPADNDMNSCYSPSEGRCSPGSMLESMLDVEAVENRGTRSLSDGGRAVTPPVCCGAMGGGTAAVGGGAAAVDGRTTAVVARTCAAPVRLSALVSTRRGSAYLRLEQAVSRAGALVSARHGCCSVSEGRHSPFSMLDPDAVEHDGTRSELHEED